MVAKNNRARVGRAYELFFGANSYNGYEYSSLVNTFGNLNIVNSEIKYNKFKGSIVYVQDGVATLSGKFINNNCKIVQANKGKLYLGKDSNILDVAFIAE